MSLLSKLPIPCHHTEVIENKDDKETCNVVFKIDTDFFRCTFPGCRFSHIIAKKTHTHDVVDHSHVSKHTESHRPKHKSNDERKRKE